ncbi:MAG: sulfate ABC transporter permease [Pyrobaculum sp.]|jgi:molybdate/tungstate transport system permease protein
MAYLNSVYILAGASASLLFFLLIATPMFFFAEPPPGFLYSLALTAVLGAATSALALPFGLASAMAARRRGGWEAAAMLMYLPAVIPPTSVGVLLLATFNLPRLLCQGGASYLCGLSDIITNYVVNNVAGIFIAMYVMALPVAFSIYDGALREERAEAFFRSLGFGGLKLLILTAASLRTATLSAFIFSWIRSFGELGVLLVFASYPPTTAIYIYNTWLTYGVPPAVGASIVLMTIGVAAAYLLRRWSS